jgi:hypothetical protein
MHGVCVVSLVMHGPLICRLAELTQKLDDDKMLKDPMRELVTQLIRERITKGMVVFHHAT